jgi:hypothetical protein
MKASILLSFLDGLELSPGPGELPAQVAELLEYPPLASAWVPAVHARSAWLAAADLCFPGDDRRALEWSVSANSRLARSGMYASLIGYVPPVIVLQGASLRMQAIYRGMTLKVESVSATNANGLIAYPHHLVPRLSAEVTAQGLAVALRQAKCRDAEIDVVSWTPTEAKLEARWAPVTG